MSWGHIDMHSVFSEEKLLLCDNNNVSEDPKENKVHEVAHRGFWKAATIFSSLSSSMSYPLYSTIMTSSACDLLVCPVSAFTQ